MHYQLDSFLPCLFCSVFSSFSVASLWSCAIDLRLMLNTGKSRQCRYCVAVLIDLTLPSTSIKLGSVSRRDAARDRPGRARRRWQTRCFEAAACVARRGRWRCPAHGCRSHQVRGPVTSALTLHCRKLRKNAQEKAVKESVYEERLREQYGISAFLEIRA